MKKIMMTLMAAVMAAGVNAQVFVGGGVGVGSISSTGADDVTAYKFVPEVGYTFNEDWAAGVAFGWEGTNKGGAKTFSFNPYARYFVFKGKVSAFLDGGVGFEHTYNAGYDQDGLSVGIKPGVAVALTDHLSFVTHVGFIGYQHSKNNKTDNKTDVWGIDVDGNNIILGLYYNF